LLLDDKEEDKDWDNQSYYSSGSELSTIGGKIKEKYLILARGK